jgi:hypothetical protein
LKAFRVLANKLKKRVAAEPVDGLLVPSTSIAFAGQRCEDACLTAKCLACRPPEIKHDIPESTRSGESAVVRVHTTKRGRAARQRGSVMAVLEFHELAKLFPMMTVDDAKALGDDIKVNGQHEPIWLYEDKVLDGRNRYLQCIRVDVEPALRPYLGEDPLAFVISLNPCA